MERETIIYVEIPVKITSNFIPGEPADYSERSPCPASPDEIEIVNIKMPEMPTTANGIEKWLDENSPDWLDQVSNDHYDE